ncbi:alpha/beta hydrolase family protein [Variovorax paradoxus B4]|uniref:Alpha/beta hydrolase family protein n=2 Tax=Variovorax paradoxus TaxID=34073 RepID=T1XDF7_VARPD|nr:alpha/beta hydrolase [Variovorax paradoxus]AGU50526.1 alpha/beta hydrolase family protein [Variovorax paradoxus B4]KLN53008.1 putative aminoacrylate hydrolase RutD [Variovorax paradoxus]
MSLAHPSSPALSSYVASAPLGRFTEGDGTPWGYRDNARRSVKAPLVLLPGALGNGDTAWQVAQAFDAERRVVSVTYPGGRSPAQLAEGLAALLRDLDTGPVALWGSSYGAWWAQHFAAGFPQQVSALWLGNTFVDGSDVKASPLFDAAWLDTATDDQVVSRWHAALAARPDDLLRSVQLHMLHHGLPAGAFRERLRQVAHAQAPASVPAIAGTVVCDCADDPTITPAVRARVRALYPDARHLSLATGGHYPHIVAPQPLIAALRDWLA